MKRTAILVAALSLNLWACGSGNETGDVLNPDAAGDALGDVVVDVPVNVDVLNDTGRDVVADVGTDVVADVVGDSNDEDVTLVCPGNAGCECSANSQCYSEFCVETSGKMVCSNACDDEDSCPRGWTCSQVTQAGDTLYICIDPFARACRPCVEDTDCEPSVGGGDGVFDCIPYGPNGSFCGNGCTNDEDCSDGFHCVDNPAGSGRRCISESGTCECTQTYIDRGYLTECYVENIVGTCYGTRTCDGVCDAVEAVAETCNQADDDCDSATDEGISGTDCTTDNIYGSCPGTATCVNGVFSCSGKTPANETCNGMDDDCDGATDEESTNCITYYKDSDDDGFGLAGDSQCLCQAYEDYSAIAKGDCNDGDVNIYPGVVERCNGKDDNCDAQTDEQGAINCVDYYKDVDDDSWGLSSDKMCLCAATGDYTAVKGGDCNDGDAGISGGGIETCNGLDDDCDGQTDEVNAAGCVEWYKDVDGDTFGAANDHMCLCSATTAYKVDLGGDCNDGNAAVNPATVESCNDIDDNCNGSTDEEGASGCSSHYFDNDGDQYGTGTPKCLCDGSGKYTALAAGDCNDTDGSANPGMPELCNSKDDDCDASTDEAGATGCTNYFLDTDRDNYGVSASYACLCAASGDFRATIGGDCNDADETVNPSRTENCDGLDNDCDSATDEDGATGCTGYYMDSDRDGYGDVSKYRCMCLPILGTYDTTNASDCCDIDANAFPGANPTTYYSTPTQCATAGRAYDYDCSGANEKQYTVTGGGCDGWAVGTGCGLNVGWSGSAIPDCGVTGEYVYDGCGYACFGWVCCDDPDKTNRVQTCH